MINNEVTAADLSRLVEEVKDIYYRLLHAEMQGDLYAGAICQSVALAETHLDTALRTARHAYAKTHTVSAEAVSNE